VATDANAGGGAGFLFHAAEIKPRNGGAGEKISRSEIVKAYSTECKAG
jgi:hypothetical protein